MRSSNLSVNYAVLSHVLFYMIILTQHILAELTAETFFPPVTRSSTEEQYDRVFEEMRVRDKLEWEDYDKPGWANLSIYLRFHNRRIAPFIIRRGPFYFLNATYKSGHRPMDGNNLTRAIVKEPPVNIHWNASKTKLFTLLHTNLDDTNLTDSRKFLRHIWMVCNIPGCNVKKGETVLEYESPNTTDFWGMNRCTYLAFPQEYRLNVSEVKDFVKRGNETHEGSTIYDMQNRFDLDDARAGSFYCLLE